MKLQLVVVPKSSRDGVAGWVGDRLKLRVTAPPERGGARAGLLTYRVEGRSCEVVTLQAVVEGVGVGRALLEALGREGRARGWQRIGLVTTNDNARAIRFYEARGFRRVAVHRDAVAKSRELKPEIPERARDGTPIRDELEFELALGDPG